LKANEIERYELAEQIARVINDMCFPISDEGARIRCLTNLFKSYVEDFEEVMEEELKRRVRASLSPR